MATSKASDPLVVMNASGTNLLHANFTALSLIASHIPQPREPARSRRARRSLGRGAFARWGAFGGRSRPAGPLDTRGARPGRRVGLGRWWLLAPPAWRPRPPPPALWCVSPASGGKKPASRPTPAPTASDASSVARSARAAFAPWSGGALGVSFRLSLRSLSGFVAVARFSSAAAAGRFACSWGRRLPPACFGPLFIASAPSGETDRW